VNLRNEGRDGGKNFNSMSTEFELFVGCDIDWTSSAKQTKVVVVVCLKLLHLFLKEGFALVDLIEETLETLLFDGRRGGTGRRTRFDASKEIRCLLLEVGSTVDGHRRGG